MSQQTPSKQGNRRRFDELVAMRRVFGNDEVLLEEIVRNMSNRDASQVFRPVDRDWETC